MIARLITRFGVDAAFRALVMLGVALAISVTAATAIRVVAAPWLLDSFKTRFSFHPGMRFGEAVADLAPKSDDACVFIGASNVREGFDARQVEREMPGTRVVNAATTGGNNEVLEIQTAILANYDIHPRCVIAGVSLWSMFRNGSPSLTAEEYLGLMRMSDVAQLNSKPLMSSALPRILQYWALPLRSHARQLNRIVRLGAWSAHERWIGPITRERYESYPDELKASEYLFENKPPILRREWNKLVRASAPWYPASRYGGALQAQSMRTTLNGLLALSPHVFVVLTPQTPILDPATRSGAPSMRQVLGEYAGRVTTIDCSSLRDLDLFYDEGHLNQTGRAIISKEIGLLLRDLLAGKTPPPQPHCQVKPL